MSAGPNPCPILPEAVISEKPRGACNQQRKQGATWDVIHLIATLPPFSESSWGLERPRYHTWVQVPDEVSSHAQIATTVATLTIGPLQTLYQTYIPNSYTPQTQEICVSGAMLGASAVLGE